jgi:hypothetical protein
MVTPSLNGINPQTGDVTAEVNKESTSGQKREANMLEKTPFKEAHLS